MHEGVATYMLPTASIGLVLLAWKGSPSLVRFMLQFIGMLAILSMFMNWNSSFGGGEYWGSNHKIRYWGNGEIQYFHIGLGINTDGNRYGYGRRQS